MEAVLDQNVDKSEFIMFAIGRDRPGIVGEVARYLTDRGASIEDSRMSAMGGLFSMTIMFTCPRACTSVLVDEAGELADAELEYRFYESLGVPRIDLREARPFTLKVRCMDHPGVVKEVVRVLHDHGVNIESMDTEMECAPFCGTPIFHLRARASLPKSASFAPLEREMEDLAFKEDLDVLLQRLEEFEQAPPLKKWAC